MSVIASTSDRLHSEFVRLLFLQTHRETDRFFAASGVQLAQHDRGFLHFRHVAFFSILKSRVGNILAKSAAKARDKTLENTLKAGINTKLPTCDDKGVFTDE